MLERAKLLQQLETVAPALADNDLVPVFTHFVFTGSKLMAYCERLAISVPLKTDFKAAVPGKILLDMLRASSAKNVDLQKSTNGLKIKAGSGTAITLPMLPAEDIFQMPAAAKADKDVAAEPEQFFSAIDDCLQSVEKYSTRADLLGITVIPNGSRAGLYSNNNSTLSHSTFKTKTKIGSRVILAADFCTQMLRLQATEDNVALEIRDGYAMFSAGAKQLYGKMLQTNDPVDYDRVMSRIKTEHTDKTLCDKPEGLDGVLDRAVLITDIAGRDVTTRLTVEGNKAKFESESERGKVIDTIELKHPNIVRSLKPQLWRKGYDRYEKFKITENAVIMTHPTGLFAVSVSK